MRIFTIIAALVVIGDYYLRYSATNARAESILILGDSLTAGYGLSEQSAFPFQLQSRLRMRGWEVDIINGGVSGDTTLGGLNRLDWMLSGSQNIVIAVVALGANDGLRALPTKNTEQNIDRILLKLKTNNILPILAGMLAPPNLGKDYGLEFNSIFPRMATKHNVLFYPFFLEYVAGVSDLNLNDGMHPNEKGVAVMVKHFLPLLEQALHMALVKKTSMPPTQP